MAKHAIIIGIDDYRIQTANSNVRLNWSQLRYCAADADRIFDILVQKFSFPRDQIIILKNSAATTTNILSSITQVFHNAQVGDTVFFYFSGHGGLLPASTEINESRFYQAIIPYDGDWIYDYRLHRAALNAGFDANSINFTCFIDSCHSGGMHPTVTTDQAVNKAVPFTASTASLLRTIRDIWPFGICMPDGSDQLFPNVSNPVIDNEVLIDLDEDPNKTLVAEAHATLISACKYHEVAWELPSKGQGALTQALMDVTRGDVSNLTYNGLIEELVIKVRKLLDAEGILRNFNYPSQVPTLRGQSGRMNHLFLEEFNTSIQS